MKFRASELKLFFYFLNERHRIYLNRKAKKKWPWTQDKILQTYKFTNVYRQLDRVTEAWTHRWINLLHKGAKMSDGDIFFHLCVFRFFNWPGTYDALYYGMNLNRWKLSKAIEILRKRKDEEHEQIFTGAYIITGGGSGDGKGQDKYVTICNALQVVYENRRKLARLIRKHRSMEIATAIIAGTPVMINGKKKKFDGIPTQGGFTSYEIVCDLRHTRILADALDIKSWANPGPGAKRGIHRLLTGDYEWSDGPRPDYNAAMRQLLVSAPKLAQKHVFDCEWPFEMREIEHSLCEFDKYRRVQKGEGTPRSRYKYRDPERLPWDEE